MYFVNTDQIELRLSAIPEITAGLREAVNHWDGGRVLGFVQERSLHLAIEIVTDVGSYLIDGFILRDASSYEDIIEIVHEAGAFDEESYNVFMELVPLRKPLVQDYYAWDRTSLHPITSQLPDVLDRFADQVRLYLEHELGPFKNPAAGSN
ncbi:DUF86 domain-containing protein [Neobacillus mesonae]|nr:DUF86 domain-containing protein [Neobacillus mesonae]